MLQVDLDRIVMIQGWDARIEGRTCRAQIFLFDLHVRQRSEVSQIRKRALIGHGLLPIAHYLLLIVLS